MNRELLKRMTKDELIELAMRQAQAIDSLDMQRYDANAIIDHLVTAARDMKDIRCSELQRERDQDRLDDYIREMHIKYPNFIVKTETGEYEPQNEQPS